MFAILDRIIRFKSIGVVYHATLVFNSQIKGLIFQHDSGQKYKEIQSQILDNSSLLLWHLYLTMSSVSKI